MNAYVEALRQSITPDSVVLDIGAGAGIMSLIACQPGARKVYSVEPDDVIKVAEDSARANGFLDRVVCMQGMSARINLPERADVIVSDLRGTLPLLAHHIPSIIDARQRLLTPSGTLLPFRDDLRVAVVSNPDGYRSIVGAFRDKNWELNLELQRNYAVNEFHVPQSELPKLLTEPRTWAVIDYRTVDSPNVCGTVTWNVSEPGAAHGLSLWFDANVANGIVYSTAPDQKPTVYRNAFLAFPEPIDLEFGDAIVVELAANLVVDRYVWRWNTSVTRNTCSVVSYRQSTFHGTPISPARLLKRAPGHRPTLGNEGQAVLHALQLMGAGKSSQDIAGIVFAEHGNAFASPKEALQFVSTLAEKYGQ